MFEVGEGECGFDEVARLLGGETRGQQSRSQPLGHGEKAHAVGERAGQGEHQSGARRLAQQADPQQGGPMTRSTGVELLVETSRGASTAAAGRSSSTWTTGRSPRVTNLPASNG